MDTSSVKVDDNEIFGLKPDEHSDYRRDNLDFIFQFYNLIPNLTVACGLNVRFLWYTYAVIFAGVMLAHFIVNALLVLKINKITPAEVLKNR